MYTEKQQVFRTSQITHHATSVWSWPYHSLRSIESWEHLMCFFSWATVHPVCGQMSLQHPLGPSCARHMLPRQEQFCNFCRKGPTEETTHVRKTPLDGPTQQKIDEGILSTGASNSMKELVVQYVLRTTQWNVLSTFRNCTAKKLLHPQRRSKQNPILVEGRSLSEW